jgi:hypothetical protein
MSIFAHKTGFDSNQNKNNMLYSDTSPFMTNFNLQNDNANMNKINTQFVTNKSSDPVKLKQEMNQLLDDANSMNFEYKRPNQQDVINALEQQEGGGGYRLGDSINSNQKYAKNKVNTNMQSRYSQYNDDNIYDDYDKYDNNRMSRNKSSYNTDNDDNNNDQQSYWTDTEGQGRWYGGGGRRKYNNSRSYNNNNYDDFDEPNNDLSDRSNFSDYSDNDTYNTDASNISNYSNRSYNSNNYRNNTRISQSRDTGAADPLAKYREYVAFIRDDMNLKGGPLTNSFAAYFREIAKKENPGASQDELNDAAIKIYQEEKRNGRIDDVYNQVKENYEKKRAQKKEQKAAMKAAMKQMAKQSNLLNQDSFTQ